MVQAIRFDVFKGIRGSILVTTVVIEVHRCGWSELV